MNGNKPCKDRVKEAFKSRMKDLRTLHTAEEQQTEELGNLNEYGLSIDFVEAGTFKDQKASYIRYQLSWDEGMLPRAQAFFWHCLSLPSEEFRIYQNGVVEFWLLDWFDGASAEVEGEDAAIIKDIVSFLPEATRWGL